MHDNQVFLRNFLQAICGSLGSIVSMTILHPLEIARTRLQVDPKLEPRSSIPLVLKIYRKDGISALYQGWSSLIVSLSITNFVYFFAFHGTRSIFLTDTTTTSSSSSSTNDLICAAAAGIITVLVTNPFWVVNTRLKLTQKKYKHDDYQSTIIKCMINIIRNEGIKTLWSGTSSSLFLVTNPTIQFSMYEALKRSTILLTLIDNNMGSGSGRQYLVCGALSKLVATLITYPLQVIQTQRRAGSVLLNTSNNNKNNNNKKKNDNNNSQTGKIDNNNNSNKQTNNNNIVNQVLLIIQKSGYRGLYSGLESKLLQTCLNAALMFFVYEELRNQVFALAGGFEQQSIAKQQ